MTPHPTPPVWLFRLGHWFQSCSSAHATIGLSALAMGGAGALAALLATGLAADGPILGTSAAAALAGGAIGAPLGWMTHRLLRDLTATRSELLAMTTHDAATQTMNRRYFMRRAQEAIDRVGAQAGAPELCVVLIRVERFDELADRHGRAFADDVLRAISGACLQQLRAHDLFARHGDDEFVGLLQASHPNLAEIALARLQRAVDVLQHVDHRGATVPVAVSFGMARVDYDARSLEQALSRIGQRGQARRAGDRPAAGADHAAIAPEAAGAAARRPLRSHKAPA
ncbi:MAG: GGDEF domain-containing protein [Burkholderiaceae bacterium]